MRSPPILSDEEAQTQAARAQRDGETVVRNHLSSHLDNNPGASSDYVSWLATLHPENADVTIDERFFVPGNPWWSIYEETVNKMPYAYARPVTPGDETNQDIRTEEVDDNHHDHNPQYDHEKESSSSNEPLTETPSPEPKSTSPFWLVCNPIDMLVGLITIFQAVLIVFVLEVIALAFYFISAFFYKSAKATMEPVKALTAPFYALFMIMYFTFALSDSIILLSNVLVTEIFMMVGWLLGCLFGGILIANERHQYIRKVCHHIRWGFRHDFTNPSRNFNLCHCSPDGDTNDGDAKDESQPEEDVAPTVIVIHENNQDQQWDSKNTNSFY
jgi:hypothetical protein